MRHWTAWAGLTSCLLASVTAAQEIDSNEVRVITPTKATSTCIGDPKTPVCAVETMMACVYRLDMDLCRRVGIHEFPLPEKKGRALYRILSVDTLSTENIPPDLRGAYWMQPGYVEMTVLELDTKLPWCSDGCRMSYSLKPSPTGWEIVSWSLEGME